MHVPRRRGVLARRHRLGIGQGRGLGFELRREDTWKEDVTSKVVATVAFSPPFFHFSGRAAQQIAIRNLYAQGTYKGYNLWVGSRMYRGDDIYLLDFWPLDNQNTVGGGVGKAFASDTHVALHAGMQRLDGFFFAGLAVAAQGHQAPRHPHPAVGRINAEVQVLDGLADDRDPHAPDRNLARLNTHSGSLPIRAACRPAHRSHGLRSRHTKRTPP